MVEAEGSIPVQFRLGTHSVLFHHYLCRQSHCTFIRVEPMIRVTWTTCPEESCRKAVRDAGISVVAGTEGEKPSVEKEDAGC